jgi:hypothetical protein
VGLQLALFASEDYNITMSRAASFAVVGLVLFTLYKVAKSLRDVEKSTQSVAVLSRLVAVDVAIIPQGVVASRSVAISKIMLASNPQGFALGNLEYSRRPHVTLLQMYCERDKLPLIFEAVAVVCDGIAGGALDLSVSQITAGSLFNGVQMPSFEVTPVVGLSLLHSELTSALDKYRVQDSGRQEYFYSEPDDGPINGASQDYVANFRQGILRPDFCHCFISLLLLLKFCFCFCCCSNFLVRLFLSSTPLQPPVWRNSGLT